MNNITATPKTPMFSSHETSGSRPAGASTPAGAFTPCAISLNGMMLKQCSFTLKDILFICRITSPDYCAKKKNPNGGSLWLADNAEIGGVHPRFHPEHVDYMIAAINGLMTETEASDLWTLRRKAIKKELSARALTPSITTKNSKSAADGRASQ